MKIPRVAWLSLLGTLTFLSACPRRHSDPRCVIECARAPTSGLDGAGRVVSDLRRSALLPGAAEDPAAVFHVYLLFPEKSERTYVHRRVAAQHVMALFTDVVDHREVTSSSRPAVLYVPMRSETALRDALVGDDVDAFLDAYDYEGALKLRQRVEAETQQPLGYRVALVGSARALRAEEPLLLDQLYVASLELPPSLVEARILGFRDTLLHPTTSIADTEVDAASRSRGFFQQFVSTSGTP